MVLLILLFHKEEKTGQTSGAFFGGFTKEGTNWTEREKKPWKKNCEHWDQLDRSARPFFFLRLQPRVL